MKRMLSALIVLCLVLGAAACGSTETASSDNITETELSSEIIAEETTLFVNDDLPSDLNLDGRKIGILIANYNNAYYSDFYSSESGGNRLSSAIYDAVNRVSERLNAELSYTDYQFTWSEMDKFSSSVQSVILSGDTSVDLIMGVMNFAAWKTEGKYFADLAAAKYIDLSKPWYNHTVIDNMPNAYIDFVAGDVSLANSEYSFGIYCNKNLYESLGKTDDLYAVVDDGKWTLERLETLLMDTYADLDGDSKAGAGDRYGLTFGDSNKYLGFEKSLGIDIFRKTDDGYEFTYDNGHAVEVIQKLCSFVNENISVLKAEGNTDGHEDRMVTVGGGNYISTIFMSGNALFTASLILDSSYIVPNIDFSYALLPCPKWNESMKYQTMLQRSGYALIPVSSADTDIASAVLEALSSEWYRSIIPEYCEVSLKTRYSQDDDVSRMFDLIVHSVVFDPGEIFASLLGTPSGRIRDALNNNDPNWESRIAKEKDSMISKMQEIINA